ncbi:MAG: hypothetical protein AAFY46_15780, partial [Planctomycetota bacterium]
QPDRYPIAFWPSRHDLLEVLLLQGGTGLFDERGQPVINSPGNARVVARAVSWCVGPNRIAADVRDFEASGNQLKAQGYTAAYLTPDWMCNVWKNELPQVAGTLRIVPLPAWEPGGRRASVWGGTMLAIPRDTSDLDTALRFAETLYLSPQLAREQYRRGDIITPLKRYWDEPVFDEPDAYFGDQRKGRLFIDYMGDVPPRFPSPLTQDTAIRVSNAAVRLLQFAERELVYDADALVPEAQRLLDDAQGQVQAILDRNVFLAEAAEGETP